MCFDVSVVVLIKDIALKERGNQPALERLTLCVRLIVCVTCVCTCVHHVCVCVWVCLCVCVCVTEYVCICF